MLPNPHPAAHFPACSAPDHPLSTPMTRLLTAARSAISLLSPTAPLTLGRIRGTGPGVSFGKLIEELETAHPITLKYPFEGSDRVGGAVWDCPTILGNPEDHPKEANAVPPLPWAIAKLRWLDHATDLPMHIHEHAERFIIVLEGRGFFHWSDQDAESFDGSQVHTIAARSRDVFVFRRGLVHTFSTSDHAMTLISVQCPYIPFNDPKQYRIPDHHWTQGEHAKGVPACVVCDLHQPSQHCPL